MPAEARNVSKARNFAGSICSLSCENQENCRALFKSAYANSATSFGNMLRMSEPRLPARDVPGTAHTSAMRTVVQRIFLMYTCLLLFCDARFGSRRESVTCCYRTRCQPRFDHCRAGL